VATFETVDAYIASFPPQVQQELNALRATMRDAAPGTDETISYGIPTLTLDGRYLVYFASWKHHISVYPVPAGDAQLQREIGPYLSGKGTLRFPHDKRLPLDLIGRAVRALMNQRRESSG
jgi:uncharacterized protein YdhG (YjbR/CyaY superfamily)